MRLWLTIVLAAAGCSSSEDDPRMVVPGGGGGGGQTAAPDASTADGGGGGGGSLEGEVCVVLDLGDPFECPGVASARDVLVSVVGGAETRSDSSALFAV